MDRESTSARLSEPTRRPALLPAAADASQLLESLALKVSDGENTVAAKDVSTIAASAVHGSPDLSASLELLATMQDLCDVPLFSGNRVNLLIDGPQTYRAMLEAIRSAKATVHLETYLFADDKIGEIFAEALIERAAAGVKVRVIYDSFGSRESASEFFERLMSAAVEVFEYNPYNPLDGGDPTEANNRTHRKILTVDGTVAFTGGINLSKFYSRDSRSRPRPDPLAAGWRDTHMRISGPAAQAIDTIFAQQWAEQGEAFAVAEPDPDVVNSAMENVSDDLVAVMNSFGGDGVESPIFNAYIEAMRLARERIWITQGYFAPDNDFTEMLAAAAERGVDVRLIVPGFSDTNVVVHASRSRYGELLKRGIRIYETKTTVLHAKTAVIDGVWSTIGSSNLDYRSFLHNDEMNAIVFGGRFGAQLEEQFIRDMQHAQPTTYRDWRRRPAIQKVKEACCWAVEYWL